MRIKALARIHVYEDEDETIPVSVAPDKQREVIADGYQERSAGRFRLLAADGAFTVPLGSVAVVRAVMIRVEGEAGANLSINGLAARQLRPVSDAANAAEATPVAYYMETTDNVTSITITHPGPGTADPITGTYELIGDAVA